MIKSLILYQISFGILFLIVHFSLEFGLDEFNTSVRFNLWDTNVFFAVASLLICVHLELFSLLKNLKDQLGFIYLPTLFIKGALFFVAFKDSVINLEALTKAERLCLVIPILIFLALEVFFVIKIIRKAEV